MDIDWTKYLEIFPDRYIKESKIDKKIRELLKPENCYRYITWNILDIGANRGTQSLANAPHRKYFLDPYVEKPDFYDTSISWNDIFEKKYEFDIIVAKNSFNYLNEKEIKAIPTVLKQGGIFIANTFIHPTEINREFVNSKTGIKGVEKTVYKDGKIYHYLYVGENIIEHSFYYYDFYNIIEFFKNEKLKFEITSPTSMIIIVKK